MSLTISKDVWAGSTATGGGRLVMLALADMCNAAGICKPSIATISEHTRLSERQVQYLIRELVAAGELFVVEGSGRHHPSIYHVTVERVQRVQPATETTSERVQSVQERVQSTQERVQSTTDALVFPPPQTPSPLGGNPKEPEGREGNGNDDGVFPRWVAILEADPRSNGKFNDGAFIADIEASFATINLTIEAQKCLVWLQTNVTGKKRKDIAATWLNWLGRAANERSNSHGELRSDTQAPASTMPRGW